MKILDCSLRDFNTVSYSIKNTRVIFQFISKPGITLPNGLPIMVTLCIDIKDASSIISTLSMPEHNPVLFYLYPIQNLQIFAGQITLYNDYFIINLQDLFPEYSLKINIDCSDKEYLIEYLTHVLFVELLGS